MRQKVTDLLKKLDFYFFLFAGLCVLCLFLRASEEQMMMVDTPSYVNAWHTFTAGKLDILRTPVYPAVIGMCMSISATHYLMYVIILQNVVSLVSSFYLKKTLCRFCTNRFVVYVLIFGYLQAMTWYNNRGLTESFSISGMAFLFYFIIRFYYEGDLKSVLWSIVTLTILVFLRPAFLYLLPIYLIAFGLCYKKHQRKVYWGICGCLVVILLELGYCAGIKREYGVFAPSCVSYTNELYIAIRENLLRPEYTDNAVLKKRIVEVQNGGKNMGDLWASTNYVRKDIAYQQIKALLSTSRHENPQGWLNAYLSNGKALLTQIFLCKPLAGGIYVLIKMYMLVTLIVLYFVGLLVYLGRFRHLPILSIVIFLAVMANLATIILGAQDEYGRLFSPSLPLLILMLAQGTNLKRLFTSKV